MNLKPHPDRIEARGPVFRGVPGDSGVVNVSTSDTPGWPRVIEVEGDVKCLICEGLSSNHAVCEECRDAVKLLRAAGNMQVIKKLVEFERLDVMLRVMEEMTEDAVAKYLMERLLENRAE